MDKPSTRKTMSLVREDTASIMESRDESSVISRWSTRTTKLSRAFDFDRELLFTRVYERAMRLAYTQTLWPRQDEELTISAMPQGSTREPPVIKAMQDPAAKGRSQLIDQQLVKDGNALRRECKVLVLGDRDSGKDAVVTQIRMASQEGFSTEELASSRLLVLAEVVRAAKELVSMMNSDGIEPDIVESIHHRDLIQNLNWDGQGSLGWQRYHQGSQVHTRALPTSHSCTYRSVSMSSGDNGSCFDDISIFDDQGLNSEQQLEGLWFSLRHFSGLISIG